MAQFNSKNQSSRVARRWFTDIDINLKNHPQTGDIILKYDINAIKRSVRNLVSTNLYERPFKPSLGVNLRGMLFELDTAHTIVLENEIKELIHNFEPRAVISNIFATSLGNNLDITIMFSVINDSQPHELDLILKRVR